jgi:hypothetical protein
MSTRTNLRPTPVITNGDMSAASITSKATVLQSITKFSYEVRWTGSSPVGTLAMQVSNSYSLNVDGSVGNAGTWIAVPLDINGSEVSSIPVSGNADNGFIDCEVQGGYAVRLVYTKVSGTGTLNATINGKVS